MTRLAAIALIVAVAGFGCGGDDSPEEFTRDFVDVAVAYYEHNGRAATIERYDGPDSMIGSWYIIVYDLETREQIANAFQPHLVGRSRESLAFVEDREPLDWATDAAQDASDGEGGWIVRYEFIDPTTGELAIKRTWYERSGSLMFASGWYQPN